MHGVGASAGLRGGFFRWNVSRSPSSFMEHVACTSNAPNSSRLHSHSNVPPDSNPAQMSSGGRAPALLVCNRRDVMSTGFFGASPSADRLTIINESNKALNMLGLELKE